MLFQYLASSDNFVPIIIEHLGQYLVFVGKALFYVFVGYIDVLRIDQFIRHFFRIIIHVIKNT